MEWMLAVPLSLELAIG